MEKLLDEIFSPAHFEIQHCCLQKLRPAQLDRLGVLAGMYPSLSRGAFFLRSTSLNGEDFSFPDPQITTGNVIAWSRIQGAEEILCAVNCHDQNAAVVYVTVDNSLHAVDSSMRCLYASELSPAELNIETRNGKAIRLTIPPHALVIYS